MKLVAVALLVLGMLCNSTLAAAEGPVPFSALMQPAGGQPGIPPITDAKDQSTAASTQPAHPPRITTGGKIMTGAGIGMVVIGGIFLVGSATVRSPEKGAGFLIGGGIAAGGITLIVFGNHRRSAP